MQVLHSSQMYSESMIQEKITIIAATAGWITAIAVAAADLFVLLSPQPSTLEIVTSSQMMMMLMNKSETATYLESPA